MTNNAMPWSELIVSISFLFLIGLFLSPIGMSEGVIMMLLVLLIIAFGAVALFMWRETSQDEREALHRMFAGRIAFIAGAAVLMVGVIVQEMRHALDPWLLLSLGAMVGGKILARFYSFWRC